MCRSQALCSFIAFCVCFQGMKMNAQSAPVSLELPRVVVEAERRYLLGFPLLVAVTFDNANNDSEFYEVPDLSVFYDHGPLGVRLIPVNPGEQFEIRPSLPKDGTAVIPVFANERKTMVLD